VGRSGSATGVPGSAGPVRNLIIAMPQQFAGSLVGYPARVSFTAYCTAILVGGFLLTLPVARAPDRPPIDLVDAFFTATSACCVTGLVVRSTLHDFSPFGQGVILLLMQLGGLGIMTITTLVAFQLGGPTSMRQRAVLSETLGIRPGGELRWVAVAVAVTVLVAEALGFLLLTVATWGTAEPTVVVWRAGFHAVSAFCNAGFALSDTSFMADAGNLPVNAILCGLVIIGGLGFPVIFDVGSRLWNREPLWERLSTHSKLMFLGTGGLLVFGAVSFWLLEWEQSLAGQPLGTRILMGLFHSTTCRTAGFNTVDYASLADATLFLSIILMAIGAGPCSTAGGFKVSTFMTLLVRGWTSFRGREHANFFKRTIPPQAVERAAVTALLFAVLAIAALVAILVVEHRHGITDRPRWFLDCFFETISALGTVGLSTGITPLLSNPGKLTLVVLMLLGRLGPITVALALSYEQRPRQTTYLEEGPLFG
jgi:trk system potassium uptake protein